jgi:DNA invertase Pin-like site-specific DNA recombinase
MGRTVAYIRVSSRGQDYATQRHAIEGRGASPVAWYEEKASARTTDRVELKRLLSDVRAGLIKEVWVFKLDRLTRSGVADTFKVVDELRKAGVTLHCVADGLTVKPGEDVTSDVLVFALGLSARLESVARNDRIAAARTRMEAKGEAWGRPLRMTPAEVATARRMKSEGRTIREISAALGVPKSTAARAVQSTT